MSRFLRARVSGAALICAALASASADAQQAPPPAGALTELPTLDIFTAGRGTPLDKMDVGTEVIARKQIEDAPETTIDQIISKAPGVFISSQPTNQLHPTGQELNIRGFGSATNELVLVLVDGVPINDPYFRTVNWSQIPKDSVERIEIIRGGGATSLWGNLAMGGVINIVTRKPGDKEARAETSYGSFNTLTGDAAIGYRINDLWRFGLTFDGLRSDGYNQTPSAFRGVGPNGQSTMDATASTIANATASLYFTPDIKSEYVLKLIYNRTTENGLIYDLASDYWSTFRIQIGGQTEIAPNTSLHFNGWWQDNTFGTINAAENGLLSTYAVTPSGATGVSVPVVTLDENALYKNAGASAYVQGVYGSLTDIKLGVDARGIWLEDSATAFRPRTTCVNSLCTGPLDANATHTFEGLFGQATWRVAPTIPLDVTLGLREDFWQATNANINDDGVAQTLPNASAAHFDPRLGVKYDLGRGLDLRAAVYENFSAPGMNQMYRSFLTSSLTIANPNLVPQTNTGGEFGFDWRGERFDLSGTIYKNVVDNYIDFVPGLACTGAYTPVCAALGANKGARQYQNVGTALIEGAELYGDWKATDTLTLKAGISYTDAYLTRATAASTGTAGLDAVHSQLGQVPPWIATVGAIWNITPQLSLTVTGRALSQFYQYTNHSYQLPNSQAFTADLGLNYKVNPHFEVYGYVQNIGNLQYYDQGAIVGTGGVPPQLALPLTATIGARATF